MAPRLLLPPAHVNGSCAPTGTVQVRVLLSPIRAQDGSLRWLDRTAPAGKTVQETLPPGAWARVIWNGRVLSADEQTQHHLTTGDELLCIPAWGELITAAGALTLLGYLVVGGATTALSIGLSYGLKYLLRPPAPPTIKDSFEADEPTFSFHGIRTAQGPGAMVPVIYGRHRVGGQLLTASVEQAITEVHEGVQVGANTIQAQAQAPTLTLLLALGEGPVASIETGTIELNGQPIQNFPGVQLFTRLGTPDQSAIPDFGELRNTFSDGRVFEGPGILYTTEGACTAFVLNIAFLQGLYHIGERGDKQANIVTVGYRYRVSPGGPWQEGPSDGLFKTIITGSRTTAVRVGIRRQGLASAIYDIEVRLTYAMSTDETRAQWRPTLESVTEVQPNTQAYANTAILGLKAIATDQLQGDLPNVTVEVLGRTCRIASFVATTAAWTANPAWCVMDILTNSRYGFGIPDSQIDLGSFLAYAAYCDEVFGGETRHRLDYVLDREVRGQPLLLEMMGGSRAMLVKSEGQWHARITRNDAAVQLINAANCTNLRLTYLRDTDAVNVIEARFSNEDTKYAQDVQTWPSLDNWPGLVHKASIEVRGVTKPSRVQRALQFELNRRRLENLSIEFEAAIDALVLQPHDVFRFAHPLPGWGVGGRLREGSTPTVLQLDQPVTFVLGQQYHVYVRHYYSGFPEVRDVVNPGAVTTETISLTAPLTWGGDRPRQELWAFGRSAPSEFAVRLFRVVKMERTGEHTIRIQAIIHHGGIYDEPVAQPLPVGTGLPNPLGPPPPLVSLVAMELQRIQPSGAAYTVVNLSWDLAPLTAGYAPYGGAQVFRRTVESNALAGVGALGVVSLGQSQSSADGSGNFVPLARLSGQVMDLDDYTILHGLTYLYRVVPLSSRGIPNQLGSRDVLIHVAGPTTDAFFPGTPQNLRLLGQAVGVTTFDGQDIAVEWDPVPASPLFTTTFYVQDYLLEFWAPGQAYLLRRASTAGRTFIYTLAMNTEDALRAGQPGPLRTVLVLVYARTNTNRVSLIPATLTVTNPPPDMSMILPDVIALFEAAIIEWTQWVEPRDLAYYVVLLDTVSPPLAVYTAMPQIQQKVGVFGLLANVPYFTQIVPYDTFGPGLPSAIATFTPAALSGGQTDTTPPSVPTGLVLTTGSSINPDGTVDTWVQADWIASPEADTKGYQVNWTVPPSTVPTIQMAGIVPQIRLQAVPGNITIACKVAAFDTFRNISAFTEEVTITTGSDPNAPGVPTNMLAHGTFKTIALLWVPPSDLDYSHTEVWASLTNNLATAAYAGSGAYDFLHKYNVESNQTWYFWFRSVDTSGNASAFVPAPFAGIAGTSVLVDETDVITTSALITEAAQIENALITDAHISNLSASKIVTGTLQVLVHLGLGDGSMYLDADHRRIVVHDAADGRVRVLLGRLNDLGVPTQYGLVVLNALGQVMFHADEGGVTAQGITAGVINAGHIRADIAVITTAAQIANALIDTAHIKALAVKDANIDTLTASKITTGTLTSAVINLAGGNGASFFGLDGFNQRLIMGDVNGVLRVLLGREQNTNNFGLWIWNGLGQLMWDFSSGATTRGITDAAVETPKVAAEAITESVYWFEDTGTTVSGTRITLGSIAIGDLGTNDQVWVNAEVRVDLTAGIDALLILSLSSPTGAGDVWHSRTTSQTVNTLHVQYVYTSPGPQTGIGFYISGSTNGTGVYSWKSLVAFHRKR